MTTDPTEPRLNEMRLLLLETLRDMAVVPAALWKRTMPAMAGQRCSQRHGALAQLTSAEIPFDWGDPSSVLVKV